MCGILALISDSKISSLNFLEFLSFIQHRGQDSCGIAYVDLLDTNIIKYQKANGLVKDFKDKCSIEYSKGFLGHTRYTTSGHRKSETSDKMIHPIVGSFNGNTYVFVFNGNIPNIDKRFNGDTEFITDFIKKYETSSKSFSEVLKEFINRIDRAYNIIFMYLGKIFIIRDSFGTRPLKIVKMVSGDIFVCSEDYFLSCDNVFNKDIDPGSLTEIDINTEQISSIKVRKSNLQRCVFEYIYFMNEKTMADDFLVKDTRVKRGYMLANDENLKELTDKHTYKNKPFIVSSIPNTSTTAAIVYANTLDIQYDQFIEKNKDVNRTFIITDNNERQNYSREKYLIDSNKITGNNIILVDDSIVRGTTIKNLVSLLKQHKPNSIHIRVAAPPIISTCNLGIDIPTKDELIYNHHSDPEKLREYLDVDTVKYLKTSHLKKIFTNQKDKSQSMCMGCITCDYSLDKSLEW